MSARLFTSEDLRRMRKNLGLTQKELAKKAGVSQSLIARIENKSVDPRLSTIKKIIDVLIQIKDKRIAADIMHSPVMTVNVRDSVRVAVDLMKRHNISQMPVLDGVQVVGSIRESTIIDRIMKSSNPENVFSNIVSNVMENGFNTVDLSTPLNEVVFLFSQGDSAILVMTKGKLEGIITKIDAISQILAS